MCDNILNALNFLMCDYESNGDVFAFCFLSALKQYYQEGGRLSDLTWFNGLNLD